MDYRCVACGASDRRLWRGSGSVEAINRILCTTHAAVENGKAVSLDVGGSVWCLRDINEDTVQIGEFVPAIPASMANQNWAGFIVPRIFHGEGKVAFEWWRSLPL